MRMLKIKLSKRKEKGIALIFTLVMLSLLLILALGFALNSMFDQKAASNAANASFAAFLAQTQLKQILSLIKNDEANLEDSKFYSHDSGSPTVTDTNMLKDMLQERLVVPDLLPAVEIDTTKVNWNYIRSQDLEKRIIGRTAFVVIANGVPLGSLIDGRVALKHNEKDYTETRIGKYVSEINVRAAVPVTVAVRTSTEIDSMTDALNWKENTTLPLPRAGFANGKYTGIWDNFSILFKVIYTAIGDKLTDTQKEEFRNNLSIIAAKDKEAFWADTNGDTIIDSKELYKRFDLTRNWETANHAEDLTFIKDKILLTSGTVPDIDMDKWTETDSDNNSKGLPWLACFGYDNTGGVITGVEGSFANVYDRRCQIAANLKDYCDDDGGVNRPTSDVDPTIASTTNWVNCATHPMFTGNEKTPYINKVGFKIKADRTESGSSPSFTVGTDIEISPCIGLINIYGSNWTSEDLMVVIKGDVDIETTVGTDNIPTSILNALDCTITITKDPSGNWTTTGYSEFKMTSSYTGSSNGHSVALADQNITVKVTGIKINRIVLHNGTTAYDYTKLLTTPASYSYPFFSGNTSGGTGWFGFAVHDPRQNLNNDDWLYLTASAVDDPKTVFSLTGTGSYGAANSNAPSSTEAPTTGPDLETVTDPANANLSTAFIRNGPMESPWELGFIHRGFKWQTINLKTYDSLKAYKIISIGTTPNIKTYLAGGGTYGSGDANILDQIKMTVKAQSPQKINLKSQKTTTFDALFTKVKLGCGIDSTMSINSIATGVSPVGTDIDLSAAVYDDSGGMRETIMAFFKTVGTTNRTRSSIAGQLVLPVGATTDAAQEELIGKIINLTKVNGKVGSFTIVILAQMIKDVGGALGSPVSISKYSDDTLTSGAQDCEISVFNADINDINDSKKNIYYDEITAEQKIIVKAYRTVDGNIKITSFRYVD